MLGEANQYFKQGHEYSFHTGNASGRAPEKSIKSICTEFLVGTGENGSGVPGVRDFPQDRLQDFQPLPGLAGKVRQDDGPLGFLPDILQQYLCNLDKLPAGLCRLQFSRIHQRKVSLGHVLEGTAGQIEIFSAMAFERDF